MDLLAAWRKAETEQERDEILADMQVDEIEAGRMAMNGMPFAGELSGGGRGVHLGLTRDQCKDKALYDEHAGFKQKETDIKNNLAQDRITKEACCRFLE